MCYFLRIKIKTEGNMSPRNRTGSRRNPQFDKKLATYSLMGAAALCVTGVAKANSITYVSNVNQLVTQPGSYSIYLPNSASLTIYSDTGTVDGSVGTDPTNEVSFVGVNTQAVTYADEASAFNLGDTISTSAKLDASGKLVAYDLTTNNPDGYFSNTGGANYLGFVFAGTGGPQAGWAQIATTANASGSSFEVLDYAYENDPNVSINAGQTVTPEPSTISLLALGASGLVAVRRRRAVNA
jgi:hypothetical protein